MLRPAEVVREFLYPLTNTAVLFSWVALFLVIEFAVNGRVLGLLLLLLVLPSFFRYLMRILDARTRGKDPGPLNVDDLLWFGDAWSLFVIVHVAVVIYANYYLGTTVGLAGALPANLLLAAVIPASLAVLAVTRNPVECLIPRSVAGVIRRCGPGYWILPSYLLLVGVLIWWLSTTSTPSFFLELLAAFLVFAFFALLGAILKPFKLHDEVRLHEPAEPDQEMLEANLLKERTQVLNHAYGFISRGNRDGGFKHIRAWLEKDPEPDAAWQWFFEQMLHWEINEPALVYAQTYLGRLLGYGDNIAAVKLMLRCRLINPAFRPLPEDSALAIAAAEHCGNADLAQLLKSF
jgi:hypothetical protein